jgi:hypothetical protein
MRRAEAQRRLCLRQTGPARFLEEHEQIGKMAVLQYIADRALRIDAGSGTLGKDRCPHPEIEGSPRKWNEPA